MPSLINKIWSKIKIQQRRHLSIMIIGLDYGGKTTLLKQLTCIKNSSSGMSASHTQNVDWISKFLDIKPTIGYHYDVIGYRNTQLTVVDFSGQIRYRNLWSEYYNSVDAIIFVIDSTDSFRLVVVKDELELLLANDCFNDLIGASCASIRNDITQQQQQQQQQLIVSEKKLIKQPLTSANSQHQQKFRKDNVMRRQVPILFMANKQDQTGQAVSIKDISRALDLHKIPIQKHPWHIQAISALNGKGIGLGIDWLITQLVVQTGG